MNWVMDINWMSCEPKRSKVCVLDTWRGKMGSAIVSSYDESEATHLFELVDLIVGYRILVISFRSNWRTHHEQQLK